MRSRVTRDCFRTESEWKDYQRDCRIERQRATTVRNEKIHRIKLLALKHDTSLVGLVIVIPPEFVALRWKKADFAHLLEK